MVVSIRRPPRPAFSTPPSLPAAPRPNRFYGPSPWPPASAPTARPSGRTGPPPGVESPPPRWTPPRTGSPLQPQVEHPPDRALDRPAAQRHATIPEAIVPQPPRFRGPVQLADLAPHRHAFGRARRQGLQLLAHLFASTLLQRPTQSRIPLGMLLLGPPRRLQGQAEVMHGMAPVQDLDHPHRLQPHLGDHPIQSRPDPGRPVRRDGHDFGRRGAQAMEVE